MGEPGSRDITVADSNKVVSVMSDVRSSLGVSLPTSMSATTVFNAWLGKSTYIIRYAHSLSVVAEVECTLSGIVVLSSLSIPVI